MDLSEVDPYEQQLRAVFDSFDGDHVGSLDSNSLQLLCEQLPLDLHQSSELINALALQASSRVTFPQFRNSLLALLDGALGTPGSSALTTSEKLKEEQNTSSRGESPDREVSPKLVLGQKKYGRRSRPESADHDDSPPEESDLGSIVFPTVDKHFEGIQKLQDLGTSGFDEKEDDCHNPKKRRTINSPEKFFREIQSGTSSFSSLQGSYSQVEDSVRTAWHQYGRNGFVNQIELGQVCECIGIENLSHEALQQLFDQLDTDRDEKVSLDEFLHLLRSGVNWTAMSCVPPPPADGGVGWASCAPVAAIPLSSIHSGGASLNIIDCNGIGFATADAIVEMWESVGVTDPSHILHDLNLDNTSRPLNVASLASTLEEEIRQVKGENVSGNPTSPPPEPNTFASNLLLAALALRQAELRWMRSLMEQMACERDKLKNDLGEANQRANILAQEIDEHHSKLEKVSQNQVKLLEQKHSEAIRDLSARLGQERELLVQQNSRLEQKVAALQLSESKLASEVSSLRIECETLDQESRSLNERLAECEEANKKMESDLQEMENLQQRFNELQANQEQNKIQHLMDQLGKLHVENSSLRDRNDELTVELEVLTMRLTNLRVKRQCIDGALGGGTKRRGNSPLTLAPTDDSGDEESPRLGKVRRCSHKGEVSLDAVHIEGLQIHPLGNNESGVDVDPEGGGLENVSPGSLEKLESSKLPLCNDQWLNLPSENSSIGGSRDDLLNISSSAYIGASDRLVALLQARVKELEQALRLHTSNFVDTPTSSLDMFSSDWMEGADSRSKLGGDTRALISKAGEEASSGQAVEQLQQHCRDLESQLDNVKIEIVKILSEKKACSQENCILKRRIADLGNQLRDALVSGKDCLSCVGLINCIHSSISCVPSYEVRNHRLDNDSNSELSITVSHSEDTAGREWNERFKSLEESHASTVTALSDRCADLEKSLSMMRDEYERCEDYWAGKLDEERQLAEQEQRITDEKFSELMSKIREYEELFSDDHPRRGSCGNDGRLETIDEQDGLEKQVMELEQELDDIRQEAAEQAAEKENEIAHLQEQLQILQNCCQTVNGCSTDVAIQVSDLETGSWGSDRTFIVKPRCILGEKEDSQSSQSILNVAMSDNMQSSPTSSSVSDSPPPRSDEDTRDSLAGAVRLHHHSRHRKIRHHPRFVALNSLNPQDELKAFGLRLREQEQTCIRLQRALRAQQQQAQALLQHHWDRHKQEVADLQMVLQCTQEKLEQESDSCRDQINRLTKSDILIKDLYVENAHLSASLQSLEQRFHVLLQQQASTTSENTSSV